MLKRHAHSRQTDPVRAPAPLRSTSNAITSPNSKRIKPNPSIFEAAATTAAAPSKFQDNGRGPHSTGQQSGGDSPHVIGRSRSRLRTLKRSSVREGLLQRFSDVVATGGCSSSPTTLESDQNLSKGASSRVCRRSSNQPSVAAASATSTASAMLPASSKALVASDSSAKRSASCEIDKSAPTASRPVRRVKRRQHHPEDNGRVFSTSSGDGANNFVKAGSAVSLSEKSLGGLEGNDPPIEKIIEMVVTKCTNQPQRDGRDDRDASPSESPKAPKSAVALKGDAGGAAGDTALGPTATKPLSQKVVKPIIVPVTAEGTGFFVTSALGDDTREAGNKPVGDESPLARADSFTKEKHALKQGKKTLKENIVSPRSLEVSTATRNPEDLQQLEKQRGEVLKELPLCPFPGHTNVSWVCRACNGARHHLTSRAAMEPLKRAHGFKVHRVPNDGDCFYSSIKAAVELECQKKIQKDAAMVGAQEVTVAEMRAWVAEEMGEEQLAFYALQAKANPEDQWLDFVRPLDERIPSDEEGENEEAEEEEAKTSKRFAAKASRQSRERAVNMDEAGGPRGGCGDKRELGRGKRGRGRLTTVKDGTSPTDERLSKGVPSTDSKGAMVTSVREAGRLGRRKRGGRGPAAIETTTNAANVAKLPTRKSSRVGTHAQVSSRIEEGVKEGGLEEEEDQDEKDDNDEDSGDDTLPFVRSVDELRRFVRLEGSVVGHGRCMWADTFAHHVVSRRLGLTILFVDMERAKTAWPYRVLARAVKEGGGEVEERFVVLKREPNHFVLIKTLPVVVPDEAIDAQASPKKGQACFRRSELPDVMRRLWQIEPISR